MNIYELLKLNEQSFVSLERLLTAIQANTSSDLTSQQAAKGLLILLQEKYSPPLFAQLGEDQEVNHVDDERWAMLYLKDVACNNKQIGRTCTYWYFGAEYGFLATEITHHFERHSTPLDLSLVDSFKPLPEDQQSPVEPPNRNKATDQDTVELEEELLSLRGQVLFLQEENTKLTAEVEVLKLDTHVGTTINTALKIIGGVAIAAYHVNISSGHKTNIGEMRKGLELAGVAIDHKTLSKYLSHAACVLEQTSC
jgi:hypothetical protein